MSPWLIPANPPRPRKALKKQKDVASIPKNLLSNNHIINTSKDEYFNNNYRLINSRPAVRTRYRTKGRSHHGWVRTDGEEGGKNVSARYFLSYGFGALSTGTRCGNQLPAAFVKSLQDHL